MGARGPCPTPTAVLEARGSTVPGRRRTGEPRPPVEAPGCPSWLSREARAEWRRVVAELERMGVIAKADRAALTVYCEAWGDFVALRAEIDRRIKAAGPGGYDVVISAGLLNAKNKTADRLVRAAQQFGLTPAARARVRTEEQGDGDRGKDRFFRTVG